MISRRGPFRCEGARVLSREQGAFGFDKSRLERVPQLLIYNRNLTVG